MQAIRTAARAAAEPEQQRGSAAGVHLAEELRRSELSPPPLPHLAEELRRIGELSAGRFQSTPANTPLSSCSCVCARAFAFSYLKSNLFVFVHKPLPSLTLTQTPPPPQIDVSGTGKTERPWAAEAAAPRAQRPPGRPG